MLRLFHVRNFNKRGKGKNWLDWLADEIETDDEDTREYHSWFHPKDPAHGTLNYDIGALNEYQKRKLNVRKSIERKENEMYFKMHPEVKGFISILLRYVLHRRPTMDVHQTMAEFFNRPRHRILVDLLGYFLRIETETENETE